MPDPPTHGNDAAPWNADYLRRGRLWGGAVFNLPDLPVGSRVLELGCGTGKTFCAMQARGYDIVGIDFSHHAAGLSHRSAGAGDQGHVLIADARALPFAANTFDAVIAFHVIGHMRIQDRYCCAQESWRVLREKGTLFFREFSDEDFRAGKGRTVEPGTFERNEGILTHYFTEPETGELFSRFTRSCLSTHRWTMTVRGERLQRAEVAGIFVKPLKAT
ncbi:MAG: class I SAM-dependent methyltransferase [Methanoregula sp.]